MGNASLRLRSFAPSTEGGDRRLAITLSHFDVASSIIREVRVVLFVSPAQGKSGEPGAPHVRLQLLQG